MIQRAVSPVVQSRKLGLYGKPLGNQGKVGQTSAEERVWVAVQQIRKRAIDSATAEDLR